MVYYYMSSEGLMREKKLLKDLVKEIKAVSDAMNKKWKNMEALNAIFRKQMEELKNTKERMRELKIQTVKDFSALKKLNLKKEEMEKVITQCDIIEVIYVDDERNSELANGFVDMKRNIIMKLLKLIGEETKTRNIIGMTKEFYEWSKQSVFHRCRQPMVLTYPTEGDRYEGTIAGGKTPKPSGRGKCVYWSVDKVESYQGEWVDGKCEGKGVFINAFGAKMEGNIVNGRCNGMGIVTYPDGRIYEGHFENGTMQGKGKARESNGRMFEGEYVNGLMEGWGIFTESNGSIYEGYGSKGSREGSGMETQFDGTKFVGDWFNNKKNGYGVEIDKEGTIVRAGIWMNDFFVE